MHHDVVIIKKISRNYNYNNNYNNILIIIQHHLLLVQEKNLEMKNENFYKSTDEIQNYM